ncbi:MAG: hypothetical protein ACK47B_06770 [Armatimonadota bacterium]
MSQSVTISDELFQRLELAARRRGLASVEELLAQWQARDQALEERFEAVERLDRVREEIRNTYGEFPDSVTSLREDRVR